MRLWKCCMSIAVISICLEALPVCAVDKLRGATAGGAGADPVRGEPDGPTALPDDSKSLRGDAMLTGAYHDTLDILTGSNRCSEFFGGPTFAVHVFNEFISAIRKEYLSKNIGIRMSGAVTDGSDHETNKRYRLFEKVTLNRDGSFYQRRLPYAASTPPRVGTFDPGTRQARMLTLLHELGHLVAGADGKWLLPNDGDDEVLSLENSIMIERVCGEEILKESGKSGSGRGTHTAGKS
jgi:hypothetical protein